MKNPDGYALSEEQTLKRAGKDIIEYLDDNLTRMHWLDYCQGVDGGGCPHDNHHRKTPHWGVVTHYYEQNPELDWAACAACSVEWLIEENNQYHTFEFYMNQQERAARIVSELQKHFGREAAQVVVDEFPYADFVDEFYGISGNPWFRGMRPAAKKFFARKRSDWVVEYELDGPGAGMGSIPRDELLKFYKEIGYEERVYLSVLGVDGRSSRRFQAAIRVLKDAGLVEFSGGRWQKTDD